LGGNRLNRGEIRWYTFRPPDKRRPVLTLTRSDVIDRLNEIIVAPATRTIRGLATEVVLSPEDGMPVISNLIKSCDSGGRFSKVKGSQARLALSSCSRRHLLCLLIMLADSAEASYGTC
jgi:hypothetical protein